MSLSSTEANKNSNIYETKNQPTPKTSKPIKDIRNTQLQFNHSVSWKNSYILLNDTLRLNASTHLFINNCVVEFSSEVARSSIYLTIGNESLLEIRNSTLFLNEKSTGYSYILFEGGKVVILDSSFIGMGFSDPYPGVFIKNSQAFIQNTTFDSGFTGLHFENSNEAILINCRFRNMPGNGVVATGSNNIRVENCFFENIDGIGLNIDTGFNISVNNSDFEYIDGLCIQIQGLYYFDVYDIWLENSTFRDSEYGMAVIGQNISIIENSFLNLMFSGSYVGGKDILIENNTFSGLLTGVTTPPSSNIPYEGEEWLAPSISNAIIRKNSFSEIEQYGIAIDNYEYATLFRIEQNYFYNIGFSALAFTGNLGGENSNNRSWVIGNVINNSAGYGIYGSYCSGFIHSYLAHFQFTSFVRNAFINCSLGYTSFESDHYFLDDVRWDNGLFGNYWDMYSGNDEDQNQIGDSSYVVSTEYAEVDNAPLLSLMFIKYQTRTGSNHPVDLVRTKAELEVNNTLNWVILKEENSNISVFLDGTTFVFDEVDRNVSVSLKSLRVGEHNFTLVIQSGNHLYRDLVWVEILADESDRLTDILVLVGVFGFCIALIVVAILGVIKSKFIGKS